VALGAIQWTTVGAVAGPLLALVSLAWQAAERLRRPLVAASFDFDLQRVESYGDDRRVWMETVLWPQGRAKVLNPRPSAILVKRVEIQARRRRTLRRPAGVEVLAASNVTAQIGAGGEAEFDVRVWSYVEASDLRMTVHLHGLGRPISSEWEAAAGAERVDAVSGRVPEPVDALDV
jgi:hypothetical protein